MSSEPKELVDMSAFHIRNAIAGNHANLAGTVPYDAVDIKRAMKEAVSRGQASGK